MTGWPLTRPPHPPTISDMGRFGLEPLALHSGSRWCLPLRSRRTFFDVRPLIPSAAVKNAPGLFLVLPAPLFEVKSYIGVDALIADRTHPIHQQRTSSRTAFTASNCPIDATQVELVQGTEQRLQAKEFNLCSRPAQMLHTVLVVYTLYRAPIQTFIGQCSLFDNCSSFPRA